MLIIGNENPMIKFISIVIHGMAHTWCSADRCYVFFGKTLEMIAALKKPPVVFHWEESSYGEI